MQKKVNIKKLTIRYVIYLIAVSSVVYCIFFFPSITKQKPSSDDWFMLEIAKELYNKPLENWIIVKDPFNQWRPLPFILKALYLRGENRDLVLYNTFKLSIFVGIVILLYFTSKLFLKDREAAFLSALFFLLNPTNIGAVQNIDHIFKLTGTFFYGITIVFLYLYFTREKQKTIHIIICFLSYTIGFISDADAVAAFPAVFLLTIFNFWNKKVLFRKSAVIIFISLLIVVLYLYLRSIIVGGAFSGGLSGKQDIVLSFNILYNSFKLLVSSFIFSVSPYIYFHKPFYVALGIFFFIVNVAVISIGIFRSLNEQRRILILLLILAFIAMTPFVFIRHVSEIYSIRSTYLLMIILAYSYVLLYKVSGERLKNIIVIFCVLMLISGAYSLKVKQDMLLKRGLMAENMARSMVRAVPNPPPFSTINLKIDNCGVKDTYSEFISSDFHLTGGIIIFFVRYNYDDETLNSVNNPKNVYNLKWDCNKRQFLLLSKAGNDF